MTTESKNNLVMTAAHNFTAVGHGAVMTASSVRAGLSRVFFSDNYRDANGHPVRMAMIKGVGDEADDVFERIKQAASRSLDELFNLFFQDKARPSPRAHLLLGVAARERSGPRYEQVCLAPLLEILQKRTMPAGVKIIARGNASFMHAVYQADQILAGSPDDVCVIGCVDSLLGKSTLDDLERNQRLSSESYGRHHALIAGEAVGFVIVESAGHAAKTGKAIQARITGLGLADEPSPRASGKPCRAAGLTDACRTAIGNAPDTTLAGVLCDLNGEAARASEWGCVRVRLFDGNHAPRFLVQPANRYGDIGAASGVTLASIAARGLAKGWFQGKVLVSCSDDHGACGALVLEKGDSLPTNGRMPDWEGRIE